MLGFHAPDSFVCSARSSTLGGVSSCVGFLWGFLTTNTTTTNVSTFFFVLFVLVGESPPGNPHTAPGSNHHDHGLTKLCSRSILTLSRSRALQSAQSERKSSWRGDSNP
jgi:hypothetical protein